MSKNTVKYTLNLNGKLDKVIVDYLNSKGNVSAYLRDLIRQDYIKTVIGVSK